MGLHVDNLRMDGRGFCNGSLAGDKSGATAGSTTAGTTSKHFFISCKHRNLMHEKHNGFACGHPQDGWERVVQWITRGGQELNHGSKHHCQGHKQSLH